MKPSALFASLLVAVCATLTIASANPRGLGPSAREAARLKVRPPANFLAHYLPDDRYKIAGGVWKFVSTDLDTYYHVPQSPNMMRQPASRVIGFANAADAEEAGYVADPTDGTSATVAAATQMMTMPMPTGGKTLAGDDGHYMAQVTPLLQQSFRNSRAFEAKALAQFKAGGAPNLKSSAFRELMTNELSSDRSLLKRISVIRPSKRFRRFHSLLQQEFNLSNDAIGTLLKMTNSGDLRGLGQVQQQRIRALALQQALIREGTKQGIPATLLR